MKQWVTSMVLSALLFAPPTDAEARPLSPPLREVAKASVLIGGDDSSPADGIAADTRYVVYVATDRRLIAWDSRRQRVAASLSRADLDGCLPTAGRGGEFILTCGSDQFLFDVRDSTVEPIRLPPGPGMERLLAVDVGRRWLELFSGADQYFLDRVTGELRKGGNVDDDFSDIRANVDLDDPELGQWLPVHRLLQRRRSVFLQRGRRPPLRIGPASGRIRLEAAYGRFVTWIGDRFVAAFDTRTSRRYLWRPYRSPSGATLLHTAYTAIFVVTPPPQEGVYSARVPARIFVARWRR